MPHMSVPSDSTTVAGEVLSSRCHIPRSHFSFEDHLKGSQSGVKRAENIPDIGTGTGFLMSMTPRSNRQYHLRIVSPPDCALPLTS